MNKNIDLCGIGNALVDIQIQIKDEDIKNFNLNKGEMRLVEAKDQQILIEKLKSYDNFKSSGGSAANTIIAFSQFGGKSAYQTLIGSDEFGDFYANEFKELNILLPCSVDNKNPTGTCLVLITPDSERTMLTYLGASANFSLDKIQEETIANSKWIYIEGYEFTQKESSEAVYKAVEIAKKNNTKIAVTFSDVFITDIFYDNLKYVADNSNLIFCNEAEAMKYAKVNNLKDAFEYFEENFNNFVITLGAKGSLIKWHDKTYEIPVYPAKPIDSTGAGDMFAGGFMYGIIYTESPIKAGHLASFSSAKVVSQLGARLTENQKDFRDKIFRDIK